MVEYKKKTNSNLNKEILRLYAYMVALNFLLRMTWKRQERFKFIINFLFLFQVCAGILVITRAAVLYFE